MIRTIDWHCACGIDIVDALADELEGRTCACGQQMEQRWWGSRKTQAQWSDSEAVLVHVNQKTGEVSYPGRHDARLRDGYERQYLRSLPEVNRFEREHGVANHRMHYDNNGRGLDDTIFGERVTH
jgi:hypothetical protein